MSLLKMDFTNWKNINDFNLIDFDFSGDKKLYKLIKSYQRLFHQNISTINKISMYNDFGLLHFLRKFNFFSFFFFQKKPKKKKHFDFLVNSIISKEKNHTNSINTFI